MKEKSDLKNTLVALEKKAKGLGFDHKLAVESSSGEDAAAIAYGLHMGVETPRLFLLALPPGAWEKATAENIQQRMWDLTPSNTAVDAYPKFGVVSDGAKERLFDLQYPAHEIDLRLVISPESMRLPPMLSSTAQGRYSLAPTRALPHSASHPRGTRF